MGGGGKRIGNFLQRIQIKNKKKKIGGVRGWGGEAGVSELFLL